MDTVRVKIRYRPVRICWAIGAGDTAAFRKAVRLSHTMWGGRFNPIAIVDRLEEAERIVEVFRADMIVPIGESDAVKTFPGRFTYLINPFFHDELFVGTHEQDARAQILDIQNALVQLSDTPAWKAIKDRGLRLYEWDENDPLADVFLMHLGEYPEVAETRIDYREMVKQASEAIGQHIDANTAIPEDIFDHPNVSYLSRHGLARHYGIHSNWDYPGFYLGDATNVDDLVCFWNLRATDTSLFFVDRNHLSRYQQTIPAWTRMTNESLAYRRFERPRGVAIWARRDSMPADPNAHIVQLQQIFGTDPFTICAVDLFSWNGLNLQAPMMILGETAQLGVLAAETGKPKLSFALGDKPFFSDTWFHTQHLIASLSFIGGLYDDELHTLDPPYLPELNEFYARTMHFEYNKFRVEPESIGLVIDAADSDAFVYALPVADLFEQVFRLAGFSARPSSGGLITRQLIAQMDGLGGAGVFKIPGVRRLLKTFGPTDPFTARDAINKIGSKDPDNPAANFKDFEDLYIEPRPHGTALKASDVFTYLVEKGLFRIGSLLACPHCRMNSWIALDVLKQHVICEMCGREFNATRQLVTGEYHYRRSGVLGAEKNAQGAVPVTLTLHQLQTNLSRVLQGNMYTTSLDLVPRDDTTILPKCEVDFVWLVNGRYPEKATIILGECKDRGRKKDNGSDGGTIDPTDINNLKAVAGALPPKRFETFILLAKLCPFTQQEIDAAKGINGPYRERAILLTERELEPWHFYDRTKVDFNIEPYAGSAQALARTTAGIYFRESAQQRP
jgi:hypothetical protein